MITSCPIIKDCKCPKQIGNPQPFRRIGQEQELVLHNNHPVVFKEEESKDQAVYVPIGQLNTSSGEDWFIKARVLLFLTTL